ncbi:DUF6944 family repetitive protein [Alkalihalobacillus sp. 1P02AB]|uniref:DUF6944 family repetitive protein n=1 Tax=Alkalihalobacillus sp. 1P02AB TaxID=3132260 RepID=UPI0039A5DD2C
MQGENADFIGAWVQAIGNFLAALGSSLPDSEASLATNLGIYGNELQALGGGVQYVGTIWEGEDENNDVSSSQPMLPRQTSSCLERSPIANIGQKENSLVSTGVLIGIVGNIFSTFHLAEVFSDSEIVNKPLGIGGNFLQAAGAYIATVASGDEFQSLAYIGGMWQYYGAGLQGVSGLLQKADLLDIIGSWIQFLGALFVAISITEELENK